MLKSFVVRLKKDETYRHLYTLCQNDGVFSIIDYPDGWQDQDYERIIISDAQRVIKSGTQGAVIGTVRLLPYDNGTTVMFVNTDAIWHSEISQAGQKLFLQYIERAAEHFTELDLMIRKTKGSSKNNKGPISERELIWKIVISIILLGFALLGFVWLPWASAVLWLLFLIIAYPVALAFTASKQSMDNRNLAEIYKAGLMQVPVIGKFF